MLCPIPLMIGRPQTATPEGRLSSSRIVARGRVQMLRQGVDADRGVVAVKTPPLLLNQELSGLLRLPTTRGARYLRRPSRNNTHRAAARCINACPCHAHTTGASPGIC